MRSRRASSTSTAVRRACGSAAGELRRLGAGRGAQVQDGRAGGHGRRGRHDAGDLRALRLRRHEALAERRRALQRRPVVERAPPAGRPRRGVVKPGGGQRLPRRRAVAAQRVHAQAALGRLGGGGQKARRRLVAELARAAAARATPGTSSGPSRRASPSPSERAAKRARPSAATLPQHGVDEALRALALPSSPARPRRPPRRRPARGPERAAGRPPAAAPRARARRCARAAPSRTPRARRRARRAA